jgi:hypothetical protein
MPLDNRHDTPPAGARQFTRNSAFGSLAGVLTALSSVFASVIVAHALGVAATGVVAFAPPRSSIWVFRPVWRAICRSCSRPVAGIKHAG